MSQYYSRFSPQSVTGFLFSMMMVVMVVIAAILVVHAAKGKSGSGPTTVEATLTPMSVQEPLPATERRPN